MNGMAKLAIIHTVVIEPMDRMRERISDLIDAYDIKKLPQGGPEFMAAMDKMLVHTEKICDEGILNLEKGIRKYYAIEGSEKIYKPPEPPRAEPRRDAPNPDHTKNRFD